MKSHFKRFAYPVVTIPLSILCFSLAHAQEAPSNRLASEEPPLSEPPSLIPGSNGPSGPNGSDNDDHFSIGIGGMYQPAYMGSKKYRFQPLPAIDIKWGRFFANFQNGIGATLIDNETLTIGAGVTMTDNYRAQDVPRGIDRVPFGAGARGFVTVRQSGFEVTAGVMQIFAGGTRGMVADFSLSRPIMVSQRLFLNPSIGTTWGNRKNNDRYFGVDARESAASGLSQFGARSGFINAKAELGLQYRLTDRIGLGAVGGISTLTGNVRHSPIVQERTRPYGLGFISYTF